jgi:hypothetical protein
MEKIFKGEKLIMAKTCSAKKFEVLGGYLFPFTLMDTTPGGGNLGRIEWHIEFVKTRKEKNARYITQMLVWARQTKDPRYLNKFFLLDCNTPSIVTHLNNSSDFLNNTWTMAICYEHKMPIVSAHPPDKYCALYIETFSSIGTRIRFFTESELRGFQK